MVDKPEFRPVVGYLAVPTDWDPLHDRIRTRLWCQAPNKLEAQLYRENSRRCRVDDELIVEVTTSFRVIDRGKEPPKVEEERTLAQIFADHRKKENDGG